MTWKMARLDECCTIVAGATPATVTASYWDGDICWATPKDLSDLDGPYISDTPRKITRAGLASCAASVLPAGTVLFSSRAPIGHVAINTVPMATNQGFKSLVPKPDQAHAQYLYHWLRANRTYLEGLGNGATFKEVSKAIVSRVQVPLPDVVEQRRIAAILDQAETLRAQRRAAIAQLDKLCQAIFLEMFGNPVRRHGVAVADFVKGFESGKSLVADDEDDVASRYRVLKVSAVTSLKYRPSESKALPPDYVPPPSHFVRAGDLLFSRANTSDLIGATAFVASTPPDLLLSDKLWRFVWHEKPRALPLYVAYLFRQPRFRAEIAQRASGTSGSMKNISQEKVLSIKVTLPDLASQEVFVQRIQVIETLISTHRAALACLDELFASLQHRAFRGELLPRAFNFEELRELEANIGLEALIFVAKRTSGHDLYASLKSLYVADKMHLERHGRLIYGETYNALPKGPVPDAAYLAVKVLRRDGMFSPFDDAATCAALEVDGDRLIPLRDADLSKLDSAAIQSLEAAIRYFSGATFAQVKAATHDAAYNRTQPNAPILVEHLIEMLPPGTKERHWGVQTAG